MKHLKRFEKYNDNRLNELIVKYYNEYSEEIIEIIDSYEKSSDAQNIMEKISFIVESPGDVEIVEKDGEEIAYYIDMKSKSIPTFYFDIEKEKFTIKTV